MTLEERIKTLMEAKQSDETLSEESISQLEEKETITTKGGIKITSGDKDEDEDQDDEDQDDKDEDEDQDDDDTDVSKSTKKNKFEVKEGTNPFGTLDSNGGDSAGDAGKTSKLKVGLSRKDDADQGKLKDTATADKQEDNGDNARLKKGLSQKDTSGKLTGPASGGAVNPDQDRNAVKKVNEHMSVLFAGEELSEEFQTKAVTIFEAAVDQVASARVEALQEEFAQEVIRLQEEQQTQVFEAVEEVKSNLVDQVDDYLSEIVEQWVVENQVALESGMKVELVNGFIDGLKTLFKENYVDIPEDKLDVIEEQAKEISEATEAVDQLTEAVTTLQAELAQLKSELVFESIAEDLTDVQAGKFKELVENVEFTTTDEYTQKLKTLKESYFPRSKRVDIASETISESVSQTVMDSYVSAVAKNLKFK